MRISFRYKPDLLTTQLGDLLATNLQANQHQIIPIVFTTEGATSRQEREAVALIQASGAELVLALTVSPNSGGDRANSVTIAAAQIRTKLYARSILDSLTTTLGFTSGGLAEAANYATLRSQIPIVEISLELTPTANLTAVAKAICAGIYTVHYPI
jgi:hypothetical protein